MHSSGLAEVCGRNRIIGCADNLSETGILKSCPHDLCQIIGCCIMIGIRKSACIGKMRVTASKLSGLLIHHLNKLSFCSPYIFCHLSAHFIGRFNNGRIPAVLHGNGFSQLHSDVGAVPGHIPDSCFCKGYRILRGTVFDCSKHSHDLCGTCRITVFVFSFIIKNRSRICIDQNCCLRNCVRSFGPSLNTV